MAVTITGAATYFSGSLTVSSTFSVEAWVRTSQVGTGRVLSMDGTINRLFQFGVVSGKFWTSIIGPGSTAYTGSSTTSINDDQWHHLVLTVGPAVDAPLEDSVAKMYVDGDLEETIRVTGGVTGVTQVFHISDSGFSDYDFRGSVGEVALYDEQELTSSQVLTHFEGITDGYANKVLADNPTAYWRLNQTSGPAFDERVLLGIGGS